MNTPEPEPVDPRDLRPGPIRNASLSPELLEHIRAVFDVVEPYLDTTLEQFELGFMRDVHPESEVAVWCSITAACIDYHDQHHGGDFLPNDDEKKLLAALLAISTGIDDAHALGVPAEIGQKLLDCYRELGRE